MQVLTDEDLRRRPVVARYAYLVVAFNSVRAGIYVPISTFASGFPNDVEDPRVANDDRDARNQEGNDEEELLWTSTIYVRQDGTRTNGDVQSEATPVPKPRNDQGTECDHPRT